MRTPQCSAKLMHEQTGQGRKMGHAALSSGTQCPGLWHTHLKTSMGGPFSIRQWGTEASETKRWVMATQLEI